jgi:hypothetical protein
MGATVIYISANGETVLRGGSFPDVFHVVEIRAKFESRRKQKIIGWNARWRIRKSSDIDAKEEEALDLLLSAAV